ncbi:MAG: methyltransferase [Candidatus Acidiferrales bacterium]
MNASASSAISKPQSDDHAIWDLIFSFWGSPALLVAHDLKLFSLLGERPQRLEEVCAALKIEPRPASVLLEMLTAFGLVDARDGVFALTPISKEYLDEKSPISLGGYLDFLVANHKLWSVETLKNAVLKNSPQVGGNKDVFSNPETMKAFAKVFTRAMYAHSIGSALTWPEAVDLSEARVLLDVGGGSGAQTVGVLLQWPNLKGIVLDTPPVTAEATQYISRFPLGDRIRTVAADMFKDPFPEADVHLYGDIWHDWPKEKGELLAKKSYASLPSGGRIILREVLYNDDRTGPVAAAAYSVDMLLVTMGGQYSRKEMKALLEDAGFRDVQIGAPGAGYRSLITARK